MKVTDCIKSVINWLRCWDLHSIGTGQAVAFGQDANARS